VRRRASGDRHGPLVRREAELRDEHSQAELGNELQEKRHTECACYSEVSISRDQSLERPPRRTTRHCGWRGVPRCDAN
jgi:hypothetical protein